MKIMIGINTLTSIEQTVYSNHLQFFYRLGKNFPQETIVGINIPRRMSIDRMRNMTAKVALEGEFDYVLFIDDDVVVPVNALQRLIDCDADIAAGHTIIRGYPYQNMFFRYADESKNALEHYPDPLPETGIIPCDAVGFSCALIKCSLLKKVNPPWFVTGTHNTEDIYFCVKAKHMFPETKIVVDMGVKTFHALGTEYIGWENKIAYKEYFEKSYPELAQTDEPKPEQVDRGDAYLEAINGKA